MNGPVITLLSDYGLSDEFVGVCHGVIAKICPEARVIDVSHGIPRHDVGTGAITLAHALPFLPVGVHVGIVDPDVGGERRAVALALADGRVLVGPDNGLLWPAAEAAGGVRSAVEISHSPLRLEPVAATFHGRDIFCPVGAHLARGATLAEAGAPLDPGELIRFEVPAPRLDRGRLRATVCLVDRFGNIQLGAAHGDAERLGLRLGMPVELRPPSSELHAARYVRTFADAQRGQLILYEDAAGQLAVAISHGNAAALLELRAGEELLVAPLPDA